MSSCPADGAPGAVRQVMPRWPPPAVPSGRRAGTPGTQPDGSGNQPSLKGPSCLKRQRGHLYIKTCTEYRQNGLAQAVHPRNGGLITMCLLKDSGNWVAPSAQLGQLNSISPRALILPLMKTLQVGHSHGARSPSSSSSSWSHLSVSAIIFLYSASWGWTGVSCLRGGAVSAWHCGLWWIRPTHGGRTHPCPLAAIGDARVQEQWITPPKCRPPLTPFRNARLGIR